MCELLGICAEKPVRANDWLRAFYEHSEEHKDGWGLAVFRGGAVTMEKEPVKAADSRYLRQRLSHDVCGKDLFAHIRKATIGQIEYANCHPFVWDDEGGRTWTLMHNGTMFDSSRIRPYHQMQEGTTDSERILLYIIDRMNRYRREKGCEPDAEQRFQLLDEMILELAPENKLNLMLYDGEVMYVHTNCKDTLFWWTDGSMSIFATKPILREKWQLLPECRLLAFQNGHEVRRGTMHGFEYVENEKDLISLFAAFAEL